MGPPTRRYPGAACGEEHWAEFIVRSPTNVSEEVQVQHYSRSYRCKCRNTMYQVDS